MPVPSCLTGWTSLSSLPSARMIPTSFSTIHRTRRFVSPTILITPPSLTPSPSIVMMARATSSDTPHSTTVDLGTRLPPCSAFVRIECTRRRPIFARNVETSSRVIAAVVVRVEGGGRLWGC